MEKTDFLNRVAQGLSSHGLRDSEVAKYTDRVSVLLDELPPNELSAVLSGGINVEAFVTDLLNEVGIPQKPEESVKEEKKEAPKPAPVQKKQPEKAPEIKEEPKKTEAPAPKKEAPAAPKKAERSKHDEHKEKAPTERLPLRTPKSADNGKLRNPGAISDGKDHTTFNALFWALSPLWLVLVACVYVLFLSMIVTFVALIIVFVVALLAVVIVGTALALVGIIYGATQLFDPATLAVALYELGEGIVIGGGTMFIGIVLYNFAVRFFPWLIKQTVHMMGGFARALKRLYYRVKGAMAK